MQRLFIVPAIAAGFVVAHTQAVWAQATRVAQADPVEPTALLLTFSAPHFFAALVTGVVLAIVFELVLTNLSVAAGLNMLRPATQPENYPPHRHHRDRGDTHSQSPTATTTSGTATGSHGSTLTSESATESGFDFNRTLRTISTGFGVWTLVTASVALFFASWLASGLSMAANTTIGLILGLAIWGLFSLVMLRIEAGMFTSLVGSMFSVAGAGLRGAKYSLLGVLAKSKTDKLASTAGTIAKHVRDDLFDDIDTHSVRKRMGKFIEKYRAGGFDADHMRQEIEQLFDDTEIRFIAEDEDADSLLDAKEITMHLESKGGMRKGHAASAVAQARSALGVIRDELKSGKRPFDKAVDAALEILAEKSPEEAEHYRHEAEEYLKRMERPEADPEGIKSDLEKLFKDPKVGMAAIRERLHHIDRETAVRALAARNDISDEEARKVVDKFFATVHSVTERGKVTRDDIRNKVREYLVRHGYEEERAKRITRDIRHVFTHPRATAHVIGDRLKSIDRAEIAELIARRTDLDREEADELLDRIERTRDDLMVRARYLAHEAKERLIEAEDFAIHEADELRKTSATAAWWAFGTAVVSGAAAAIGGVVGAGLLY